MDEFINTKDIREKTDEQLNEKGKEYLKQKQFAQLKWDPDYNFRDPNEYDAIKGKFLQLASHQLFVQNYMNPNNTNNRLGIIAQTGMGKTLMANAIAISHITAYEKIYYNELMNKTNMVKTISGISSLGRQSYIEADMKSPTVFIAGFTKNNIIKDILKYPEFGFITVQEREELIKLQSLANRGSQIDVKRYKEFYSMLKRRITDKKKGGFYKFFGYQELVNRLFISEKIDLKTLEAEAIKNLNNLSGEPGSFKTLEDIINEHIENGDIEVNIELLKMFENSLLICDEVHNTYNQNMKNNYGVAIQYILDRTPTLKAVFLTATPMNNSPAESIDFLNYLLPPKMKLSKKDFFDKNDISDEKLAELGKLSFGRISFIQDVNPRNFPQRIIEGYPRKLPVEYRGYKEIPYFNFIECPMSDFHFKSFLDYKEFVLQSRAGTEEETQNDKFCIPIAVDSYVINDMVYPNPDFAGSIDGNLSNISGGEEIENILEAAENTNEQEIEQEETKNLENKQYVHKYGLFKSNMIRMKLLSADEKWKQANGIKISQSKGDIINFSGDWLKKDNIKIYSTKYFKMLDEIDKIFEEQRKQLEKNPEIVETVGEKIMIFHDRVRFSGVLQIKEILIENGFIDEYSEPVETTRCALCGYENKLHLTGEKSDKKSDKNSCKRFYPSRFIMAHSEIDKNSMDLGITKYNSPDNAFGTQYKFLIGSKIIRESYDIKDVQNYFIMSSPVNISALIQTFGRAVRKNSHINLPSINNRVKIRLFLTTAFGASSGELSPEECRYMNKIIEYKVIQLIEKEFHKYAIDGPIHRNVIMPDNVLLGYLDNLQDNPQDKSQTNQIDILNKKIIDKSQIKDILGTLYYETIIDLPFLQKKDLDLRRFNAYDGNEKEIHLLIYLIKRMFLIQNVWKYADLWKACRKPPFSIEVNPSYFSEHNFIIALYNLSEKSQLYVDKEILETDETISEKLIINILINPDEKYIYKNKIRHKIEHIGDFYILFPVYTDIKTTTDLDEAFAVKTKSRSQFADTLKMQVKEEIIKDIDSFDRKPKLIKDIKINIDEWIQKSKEEYNYDIAKIEFIKKFKSYPVDELKKMLGLYEDDFYNRLFTDIIKYFVHREIKKAKIENKIVVQTDNASGDKKISFEESAGDDGDFYENVIEFMDQFKFIIYLDDILRYREVAKQFLGGLIKFDGKKPLSRISRQTPIGFIQYNSIILYDAPKWIKVSKISMNLRVQFEENDKLIGYFEKTSDGVIKFKIRNPIHIIKSEKVSADIRTTERGIVCSTKGKREIEKIMSLLGIKVPNDTKIKIKDMCKIIQNKLIDLEIKERSKDSKNKYLYLWYENRPDLLTLFSTKFDKN